MDDLFEIHAEVDKEGLLKKIQSNLESRRYDPVEIDRIRNLSFSPLHSSKESSFDASTVSELFERTIPPPDFSRPAYRFLRGPLKHIATSFFRTLSRIYDRLAFYKVQAFYSVVYEIQSINRRIKIIQESLKQIEESGAIAKKQDQPVSKKLIEANQIVMQSIPSSSETVYVCEDYLLNSFNKDIKVILYKRGMDLSRCRAFLFLDLQQSASLSLLDELRSGLGSGAYLVIRNFPQYPPAILYPAHRNIDEHALHAHLDEKEFALVAEFRYGDPKINFDKIFIKK